jgi:HAD superfamily hydrolase (TIGR01509 family)
MMTRKPSSRSIKRKKTKHGKAASERPLIRCVIFDLDDTLYDCLGQRVRPAHRHAADAMIAAGLKGSVDQVYRARLREFHIDPMLRHIDAAVIKHFGADDPEAVSRAAHDAYFNCPVGKLTLFRGALPLLHYLKKNGVRIFITTFGDVETQHAKVAALGLDREPAIEKIYYADRAKRMTKESAFRQIQKETGISPDQILVVGDRPMSEIRAAKALGMHTVRIRRGEFASQSPVDEAERADREIDQISQVKKLPFKFSSET